MTRTWIRALVAAALFWSFAIITTRKWPPVSPIFELLPWCFGLATLMILPFALVLEPHGGIASLHIEGTDGHGNELQWARIVLVSFAPGHTNLEVYEEDDLDAARGVLAS